MNIKVCRAAGLRTTQTFGRQDPYVKIKLGRRTRKTRVSEDGHKSPVWEQTLNFSAVGSTGIGAVGVEVWNENTLSDSIIGTGTINLASFGPQTVQLQHKGRAAGTLYVEVSAAAGAGAGAAAARPPPPIPIAPVVSLPPPKARLAAAGTHLFRQSTGQAPLPPPQLPPSNAGGGNGGAQFITSVDKSSGISSSSSNDVAIPMGAGNDVRVGLGWDFADVDGDGQGDTDLDLSCVAFNANGQFMKACYFADPNPFGNGACYHNGDNRDGRGEGDDESINLDLDMLNGSGISALFFCVNSFNGSSFRAVKSASSRVVALMSGSELSKVSMALEDRRATSLISGRLTRVGRAQWVFRPLAITGKNKCFADVVPTMQAQLRDIIPRVKIAPSPAGIIMTKGESLQLLSNQFKVGLGWDQVGRAVDLDASIVCLHADYTLGECCYFGALKAYGQALVHSGDNRSGAGAGDDESITVNLNGIPPRVQYIVVTVNCYDDLPLSNVRNAYIRLSSNGAETHRYQLNQLGGAAGFTMATLYRGRSGGWLIKTNSSAGDGNTWKKMLPAIQRGCQTLLQKHL